MRVINGVVKPHLTVKQRLNESRATLRTFRTARTVCNLVGSPIAKLPPSDAPYHFGIRRRLGGVGDVIMSTSALRGLKEKFPKSKITYITNAAVSGGHLFEVLSYNPYIDNLISCQEFVEKDYDYWADITEVDLQMECAPNPPERIDIYCGYLGVNPSSRVPFYKVSAEEKKWAQETLDGYFKGKKPRVFINPASNADRRNVSMEMMERLVQGLTDKYQVIIGHHYKRVNYTSPEVFNYIDPQNLRNCIALLDACDYVVTHDTSILHIAGALEKCIVGLFGSVGPGCRSTHYKKCIPVFNKSSCEFAPCMYKPCNKNFVCMRSITVRQVMEGLEKC